MASVVSLYSRALADVVFERKVDALKSVAQLQGLSGIVQSTRGLRDVWSNPAVPGEEKRGVLDALAKRLGLERPVRNFIAVLIDHRRIAFLPEIVKAYEAEVNERMGVAEAAITAARELHAQEKHSLEAKLAEITGRKVRASYGSDPGLLGGAVVRIGSTIYDGSVRGRLMRLKEQLTTN